MGVSGSGKSTIGILLSQALSVPFFDADDFHSAESVMKMKNGTPLTDKDREPWLLSINQLAQKEQKKSGCVIACSALKQDYRKLLSKEIENAVNWIYLRGTFDQILERLQKRKNHFMSPELLQSQFDTLEEPKGALNIDIALDPDKIIENITNTLSKTEFGLLGLGVMGKSLSRNLAQRGFQLSIYNRHVDEKEVDVALDFKNLHKELENAQAFDNLEAFVDSIETPRKIMLMVNAGKTTDIVIENLLPFLTSGDVLIDGGNSHFEETKARFDYLESKNIHFIGSGVSGGEEGALKGPSIMPGGDPEVYEIVKPYLEAIAARDANGLPCSTYVGPKGSGHFVKMVHNGIEYVEMQLLAEVFSILKFQGNTYDQIANTFESWNDSSSYLLEITIDILRKKEGNDWLLDKILDKAGNKGTGNWTAVAAAQLGIPSTLVTSALFARYISFFKEDRIKVSGIYPAGGKLDLSISADDLQKAYQFARIINHYQGFKLIAETSSINNWKLNLSEIARIWTNGCIIRSSLMVDLIEIFKDVDDLLSDTKVVDSLASSRDAIKQVVSHCVLAEIAIPCLSEAVNFFSGMSTADSNANLIQAQRDYFGAHTYQRVDDLTGQFHHTDW